MKRRRSILLLTALGLLLAAGCEREAAITGSFGDAVVSGQVFLGGDLAGGSPEGIEASVPGTGMEMILAADGRFLFSGVPADGAIRFERKSDGIDATYELGRVGAAEVAIELTRNTAKRSRWRPSIARSIQLEGLIVAVDATSLTVDAAGKGETTVVLDDQTYVRRGHESLTAADLLPGDKVHVMAQPVGETLVAKLVIVQDQDEEGEGEEGNPPVGSKVELEGLIVEVDSDSITVDAAGKGETSATIHEGTLIRKGNTIIPVDELEPGWRVHVRASVTEEGLRAELIIVQNTRPGSGDDEGEESDTVELEGTIVFVMDTEITVNAAGKGEVTALIDENTVIRKGNIELSASDLNPGDRVHVRARKEGEELRAELIILQKPA